MLLSGIEFIETSHTYKPLAIHRFKEAQFFASQHFKLNPTGQFSDSQSRF